MIFWDSDAWNIVDKYSLNSFKLTNIIVSWLEFRVSNLVD